MFESTTSNFNTFNLEDTNLVDLLVMPHPAITTGRPTKKV